MLILASTSQKGTQMSDLLMGELPSEPVFRHMIFYNVASYNFAWTYFFGNKIHFINFLLHTHYDKKVNLFLVPHNNERKQWSFS